jgi:RNA polymerase sigma-70 factor (ECF subfamily)
MPPSARPARDPEPPREETAGTPIEGALEELCPIAFRVAYSVLRHREDAEDVAQEALVRAHDRFEGLRDRERLKPWLVRIAWRMAINRRRGDRRRERREQALEAPAPPSVEQTAVEHQVREHLHRELEALPESLRQVLVLAAIQGYQVREVARLLALPEGTVKSRLFEARKRLAERLRCVVKTSDPR